MQGSYLITKLRPVDQLQSLLEATRGGGGGGEAVEGFFRLHKVCHHILTCPLLCNKSLAEGLGTIFSHTVQYRIAGKFGGH